MRKGTGLYNYCERQINKRFSFLKLDLIEHSYYTLNINIGRRIMVKITVSCFNLDTRERDFTIYCER